jgi:hypothetical protein
MAAEGIEGVGLRSVGISPGEGPTGKWRHVTTWFQSLGFSAVKRFRG